jgi:hypothetical protein
VTRCGPRKGAGLGSTPVSEHKTTPLLALRAGREAACFVCSPVCAALRAQARQEHVLPQPCGMRVQASVPITPHLGPPPAS